MVVCIMLAFVRSLPTVCTVLRLDNVPTHVDQVSLESLLQVGEKGVLARVVLHEHKVLHTDVVTSVQLALNASAKRLSLTHLRKLLRIGLLCLFKASTRSTVVG